MEGVMTCPVATSTLADQGFGAMALVLELHRLGMTGAQGMERMNGVQGLDPGFLWSSVQTARTCWRNVTASSSVGLSQEQVRCGLRSA
jgi:hypothetical protein